MLYSNLKKIIDEQWDNCWPVSNLKPIAILDLASFIFFLKKADERHLITKNLPALKSGHFVFTKEIEEFSWAMCKEMEAHDIHDLFTRQFGIFDLMKEYSKSGLLYSLYFSAPLLIKPSSRLLLNVIQIIDLIESCDAATQPPVIEYLFSKAQNAQKEPQFVPQFISRLMVSIAEPHAEDVIFDISTGNGSVLINAAEYIENNTQLLKHNLSGTLNGLDSDPNLLRITAMRMMLHGIKEPDLQLSTSADIKPGKKPSLFISSLLSNGNEENRIPDEGMQTAENRPTDIILLSNILKNMQPGSRAIVLVSENLLKSVLPEVQEIRREIVDNTHLEGVIHLSTNGRSYSAAGILIFNKHESATTGGVWFCKMEKPKKRRTINETITNPNQNEILLADEFSEANVVLDQWKNRENISNRNCFFINAYDIKTNNYNVNFNDYKLISTDEPITDTEKDASRVDGQLTVATKKENLHHFYKAERYVKKRRRKRNTFPAILLIFILVITAGWSYLYYANDKNKPNHPRVAVFDSVKTPAENPGEIPSHSKTKSAKVTKKSTEKEILPATHNSAGPDGAKRYTVVNKTWFHYAPDSSKRKSFYLQPRQDLVVVPAKEENGFVYVVYVNKKGESTHGWLNKKDLEPVD